MILREDILSLGYLKKTEFTGCHRGMRYRLEKVDEEGKDRLKCTIWPEPFNYFTTPDESKQSECFDFSGEGIDSAVDWMNSRYLEDEERWSNSGENWDHYTFG